MAWPRIPRRRAWFILGLSGSAAIVVGCLLPSEALESGTVARLDKPLHAAAFAFVGACFRLARVRWITLAWIGVGLAAGTELAQMLLTVDRSAELGDLAADLVGFAVGVLAVDLLVERETPNELGP